MRHCAGINGTTRHESADFEAKRRKELASFLRAMRERTKPADLGIGTNPRRRAPGLLREEVAQAACISVTWYTWMEQARALTPSAHALRGIARALKLNSAERTYLFGLARPDLRDASSDCSRTILDPQMRALLYGLAPHPAYVLDRYWNILAWNEPASWLLGFCDKDDEGVSNLLLHLFHRPEWRTLFPEWKKVSQTAVAQFRSATAEFQGDEDLKRLVDRLQANSEEFSTFWSAYNVEFARNWCKTIDHPTGGRMQFDFASFQPQNDNMCITISIYTPADAITRKRFADLLGHQP